MEIKNGQCRESPESCVEQEISGLTRLWNQMVNTHISEWAKSVLDETDPDHYQAKSAKWIVENIEPVIEKRKESKP